MRTLMNYFANAIIFFNHKLVCSYDNACCVTELCIPDLLIASHISPWAIDSQNRLNPRNGLCLIASPGTWVNCECVSEITGNQERSDRWIPVWLLTTVLSSFTSVANQNSAIPSFSMFSKTFPSCQIVDPVAFFSQNPFVGHLRKIRHILTVARLPAGYGPCLILFH